MTLCLLLPKSANCQNAAKTLEVLTTEINELITSSDPLTELIEDYVSAKNVKKIDEILQFSKILSHKTLPQFYKTLIELMIILEHDNTMQSVHLAVEIQNEINFWHNLINVACLVEISPRDCIIDAQASLKFLDLIKFEFSQAVQVLIFGKFYLRMIPNRNIMYAEYQYTLNLCCIRRVYLDAQPLETSMWQAEYVSDNSFRFKNVLLMEYLVPDLGGNSPSKNEIYTYTTPMPTEMTVWVLEPVDNGMDKFRFKNKFSNKYIINTEGTGWVLTVASQNKATSIAVESAEEIVN